MAKDDEMLVGIELLMRAGGNVAHGDGEGAFDVGRGDLPRLANVDEPNLLVALERRRIGRGDLVVKHGSSLKRLWGGTPREVGDKSCKTKCRVGGNRAIEEADGHGLHRIDRCRM